MFSGSSATTNSMDISWLKGDGDNVLVVARAGSAVDADPVNGHSYTADATFGLGDPIGMDNYVVYNGSGTNVSLTGLSSGTTYHFAIYEYFTDDNCYNADELAGSYATLSSGSEIQLEYPAGTEVACGTTMSFGSVNNGSNSDLVFRIKNTGTDDLNISNLPLIISGTNADQFSIQVQPVSPVAGSSFTDVTVRFTPTSAGAKSAVINILSDDSDESTCSVNLSGTGVLVPLHYRTVGSGSWTSAANWEQSADEMSWAPASASPVAGDNTITIRTGYAITSSASLSVDQLTIETGGTLEITGGTFTVANGDGTDIVVNGTWTLTDGTITMTGTGEINNNGTFRYNKASNVNIVFPICTWNPGSTLLVSATGTSTAFITASLNQSFHHLVWNNTNQANGLNFAGGLHTVNGDFRLLAAGAGNEQLRIAGSANATLTIGGNLEIASNQTFVGGNGNGNATVIINGDLINEGTLDLNSDISSPYGSGIVEFKGQVTSYGQIVASGRGLGNIIKFNGASLQMFYCDFQITSNPMGGQLTMEVDNPAGVELASGISFIGNVLFTSGHIYTNEYVFELTGTINNSSTSYFVTSGSTGNFFTTGGLSRIVEFETNPVVTYPVGPSNSLYMPATLNVQDGDIYDIYNVRCVPLGNNDVEPIDPTKCVQFQWEIENFGSPADVILELQWASGTEGANFNPASGLFIGHWDGSKFDVVHNATYSPGDPSATSNTGFTSFSPFVISSESTALPVEWISINAAKYGKFIKVDWKVAAEADVYKYEVEKMQLSGRFDKIGEVSPEASLSTVKSYSFLDKAPLYGNNYYRIKQLDYNGRYTYSPVTLVKSDDSANLEIINRNQETVTFTGIIETAFMQVYDINGHVIKSKMVTNAEVVSLNELPGGSYVVTLKEGNNFVSRKLIRYN